MTGSAFEAMDIVVEKQIVNREEVWRRQGERLTWSGLQGMTGSAFEAMDVVVGKQKEIGRRFGGEGAENSPGQDSGG